ncbi:MAG: hypothetical protein KJO11_01600, partial [Gemmatimonadetes bacterium]|nr:hypothetical protein [Gemmatimonadota bacterium]
MEPLLANRFRRRLMRPLRPFAVLLAAGLAACSAPDLDFSGADGPLPDRFAPIDEGLAESGAVSYTH